MSPYDIGGPSLLPGLAERLQREISELTHHNVKIIAPPERKYLAWIGGSILGSLPIFPSLCVTREMYESGGIHVQVLL